MSRWHSLDGQHHPYPKTKTIQCMIRKMSGFDSRCMQESWQGFPVTPLQSRGLIGIGFDNLHLILETVRDVVINVA